MADQDADRNQDNKGRGNFGRPEQHARAGHQSSGNRGNPEQHAEAGRQSHGRSGQNRDDDFERESEESGGVMQAEGQVDEITSLGIEELQRVTDKLRKDRQVHITAVRAIDKSLEEFRDKLDQVLGENVEEEGEQGRGGGSRGGRGQQGGGKGRGFFGAPRQHAEAGRQSHKNDDRGGSGRGRGQSGGQGRSGTRGGGTATIENILRENGGEMDSSDLAAQAKEQGVNHPHSSFQSLKKRGRIELENHRVRLMED